MPLEPIRKRGFYLIQTSGAEYQFFSTTVYASLYDLITSFSSKESARLFTLREEVRENFFTAAVDRKNFRVQIFKTYWTKSLVYNPLFQLVDIIGGNKSKYFSLLDPIAVAYSKGKELAIIDNGRSGVVLFSPSFEVIKVMNLVYLSTKEVQLQLLEEMEKSLIADNLKIGKTNGSSGTAGTSSGSNSGSNSGGNNSGNKKTNGLPEETPENKRVLRRMSSMLGNNVEFVKFSNSERRKILSLTSTEAENRKKPCWVAFNENGNLAVGFRSGGKRNSPTLIALMDLISSLSSVHIYSYLHLYRWK
jgi:hypothetical protein